LSRSLLPLSSRKPGLNSLLFLLSRLQRCAHAHQASKTKETTKKTGDRYTISCLLCCFVRLSLHFIRILFTSKPIHELRLDLNVANTVIALTIRVIYLSLIITLKRGVVVLWFTVTCPLSSGFLPTILPAEQFLSTKSTRRFPHTHQALESKPNHQNKIHVLEV